MQQSQAELVMAGAARRVQLAFVESNEMATCMISVA
jgi:hypothetical protein